MTTTYAPNRTLGRSGYETLPEDQLHQRVEQLDALMQLVTAPTYTDDDCGALLGLNAEIQVAVLGLAADLAHEVHELSRRVFLERLANAQHASHL